MLTADLVKPRLRARGGRLHIQMLDMGERHHLRTAAGLIALFREHAGKPQGALDDALDAYEGDRLDYIIIRGFAKVLRDAAAFAPSETPVAPDALRAQLFARGPAFAQPDLFHLKTRSDLLREAAEALDTTPAQIEAYL